MSQGLGIYKYTSTALLEASFYSDMVECLPVDPASWVRFRAGYGKIFSLYDTYVIYSVSLSAYPCCIHL